MSMPQNPSRNTKRHSTNAAEFDDLFICTTCFSLTSKGAATQRCQCEPYQRITGLDCPSGYHLCYICSVRVAGGTSRWSHEACSICLDANKSLRKEKICLPLGRHSIMNGFAIPINVSKKRLDELAGEAVRFINMMTLLGELAKQRTITMFQTQGMWANVPFIPVEAWELTFALADKEERKRSKAIIREVAKFFAG